MSFDMEYYNRIDSITYDKNCPMVKKTIIDTCNESTLAELEVLLELTIKEHKEAPVYRIDGHTLTKEDHCSVYSLVKLAIEEKTNQLKQNK